MNDIADKEVSEYRDGCGGQVRSAIVCERDVPTMTRRWCVNASG